MQYVASAVLYIDNKIMLMINLHGIKVKYLPCTHFRGSRVKLTSLRFGDSITLPYDYVYNSAQDIADKWLQDRHQKMIGVIEMPDGCIIALGDSVEHTFTPLKEMQT